MENIKSYRRFINESNTPETLEEITYEEFNIISSENTPLSLKLTEGIIEEVCKFTSMHDTIEDFFIDTDNPILYLHLPLDDDDNVFITLHIDQDYHLFISYSFDYGSHTYYLYFKKDIGFGVQGFSEDLYYITEMRNKQIRQIDGQVNESLGSPEDDYEEISLSEYMDAYSRAIVIQNYKEKYREIEEILSIYFNIDDDIDQSDERCIKFVVGGADFDFIWDDDYYLYFSLAPNDGEDNNDIFYKIDVNHDIEKLVIIFGSLFDKYS